MRKILFLDIDGVMNSAADNGLDSQLCERNLGLLKQIVDATDCKVVLTSAWRHNPRLLQRAINSLANAGIMCFDTTPILDNGNREDEIIEWLEEWHVSCSFPYNSNDRYAILDDDELVGFDEHFVRTDYNDGIQKNHVDTVIDILNKGAFA